MSSLRQLTRKIILNKRTAGLQTKHLRQEMRLESLEPRLAAKLPSMFGFSVFSSMPTIGGEPDIPYPGPKDRLEGGHAVMAVGYDNKRKIGKHTGALLIRNSWGKEWGDGGYGWLPYSYVLNGLAVDFWSVADAEFIETDLFRV